MIFFLKAESFNTFFREDLQKNLVLQVNQKMINRRSNFFFIYLFF